MSEAIGGSGGSGGTQDGGDAPSRDVAGAGTVTGVDFASEPDPFRLFQAWFGEASNAEPNDPNAMSLATVDGDGLPNVRIVLLKGLDLEDQPGRGFVFYTNLESAKGSELTAHPKAALAFHWKSLGRQVRVRGTITPVSKDEADHYFALRPRASQIGAWASDQSRPMDGRATLLARVAKFTAKFAVGSVPRPPHWSGFRLTPLAIEFWQSKEFRLHDRRHFTRADDVSPWSSTRLYP